MCVHPHINQCSWSFTQLCHFHPHKSSKWLDIVYNALWFTSLNLLPLHRECLLIDIQFSSLKLPQLSNKLEKWKVILIRSWSENNLRFQWVHDLHVQHWGGQAVSLNILYFKTITVCSYKAGLYYVHSSVKCHLSLHFCFSVDQHPLSVPFLLLETPRACLVDGRPTWSITSADKLRIVSHIWMKAKNYTCVKIWKTFQDGNFAPRDHRLTTGSTIAITRFMFGSQVIRNIPCYTLAESAL